MGRRVFDKSALASSLMLMKKSVASSKTGNDLLDDDRNRDGCDCLFNCNLFMFIDVQCK